MSIWVIGDPDTVAGFRLAGAAGIVAQDAGQARAELHNALSRNDIDLLLITRDLVAGFQEEVSDLKMTRLKPVVVDIPGRKARTAERTMRKLVSRAVGISL
jgi:vacuolar-type H+-ATPase subunit F/Vma7